MYKKLQFSGQVKRTGYKVGTARGRPKRAAMEVSNCGYAFEMELHVAYQGRSSGRLSQARAILARTKPA